MEFAVKVISIKEVTHNVRRIRFERPVGYSFVPGHAADVTINKAGWTEEKRPFTFTCLNDDPYLEFTIKCYTDHNGVTNELKNLKEGDELIISESWGAIEYKGEGYFIAGGAGITPFIAILRQLHKDKKIGGNKLFFSNKTTDDIIYVQELTTILGDNFINIITDGEPGKYIHGYIDEAFLKKHVQDFSKHFYICGPDKMIEAINKILVDNGAKPDTVVFEK